MNRLATACLPNLHGEAIIFGYYAICVTFLFDGANKTNLGQIVFGPSKIEHMQSSKTPKKTKTNALESNGTSEEIDAQDTPKTPKRAAKPLATVPAPAKEPTIAQPKSLSAASRVTSTERPARSTSLHRAAKPVPVVAGAEEVKAATSVAAPKHNTFTITHDDIEKLAYSYWLARGRQGGSPYEDWIRAEHQLHSSR